MSTPTELMASGLPWQAAVQIGLNKTTGLVATGTTKAAALVLASGLNVFATVSANKGAVLPPASGSPPIPVYNGGANALSVYANGTDTINSNSAGAAFSVTNGKSALFSPSGNQWVANLSA